MHADEETFMHTASNFYFGVEDGPVWEAAHARAAREHALVCVRRPDGEPTAPFRARFAAEALPRLRGALEDACWLRSAWPQPASARFDASVLVGAASVKGVARVARELERDGSRVIAARVSVHATPMAT